MPLATSHKTLDNLEGNGEITVCFSLPTSYKTVQLKGRCIETAKPRRTDLAAVERHREAFGPANERIGFPRQGTEAFWRRELETSVMGEATFTRVTRRHTRRLKTIFGPVEITRMSYSRPGAQSIHPLDEALQLPTRSFSYEVQKRMVKAAVQGTFRETRERIAEITGAPVPTRSIEEVIQDAGRLYGTTKYRGVFGAGTVFQLSPAP